MRVKDKMYQKTIQFNPKDNKYKEFEKEPEYQPTLQTRFTVRWFNSGMKIRGFDPKKLEGLKHLPIEKEDEGPKLVIVKGKTPLYFKNDVEWQEFKLHGHVGDDDDYENQNVFAFKETNGDELKLTEAQFMSKCDHGEVALKKGGSGLIMSKGGGVFRESSAKSNIYGDDYQQRLTRLMKLIEQLERTHQF